MSDLKEVILVSIPATVVTNAIRDIVAEEIDGRLETVIGATLKNHPSIDYEELCDEIDLSDLAAQINSRDIARHLSMSDLASEVSLSDLASEISLSDLSSEISLSDLASEMSVGDVSECLDMDAIMCRIDYKKLAQALLAEIGGTNA